MTHNHATCNLKLIPRDPQQGGHKTNKPNKQTQFCACACCANLKQNFQQMVPSTDHQHPKTGGDKLTNCL